MEFIDPNIQAYAEQFTSPEPPVLASLNRETHLKVLYPRMLSGHLQGRMLAAFSKMLRPKRILEIGSYTGYSAICLAEGLPEDGLLVTIEANPELAAMVDAFFQQAGIQGKARLIIGDATQVVPTVEGPLDLVFIDADKENYILYFDLVLPKLRSGGVIVADNVLWSGRVLDPAENDKETQGLRDFVEHVRRHPDVEQVLLPVRDGILLIVKN